MDIDRLEHDLKQDVNNSDNLEQLESVRVKYLGRRGAITAILRGIKDAPPEERPRLGSESNRLKLLCESLIRDRKSVLGGDDVDNFYTPPVDGTLPATNGSTGHRHIIRQTFRRMTSILHGMGYSAARGPDVELEYYNFQALNFPAEHPSRDLQDTFYVTEDILLRTHTSPVQIRFMESEKPPLKVYSAGRVYRNEAIDQSHAAEFHQIEGLYVDTDVSMGDLRNDLALLIQELFGANTEIRFKPHFFPFTEPSVDVDMTCFGCRGEGCAICGKTGWIEILGAGMVHPNVFRAVGYDPDRYSGFAFGIGVDRVAMIKHGIGDIRQFLGNDLRFLSQF
jgi:phenylalanyl-tRNA synthetase alpha chain